jgi:glutaminyl-tRNA synthetase
MNERDKTIYGFVIECTSFEKDDQGLITAVHVNYYPDSKSGTPGSDQYKVKGNIHWVSSSNAIAVEVRLYDRLFNDANPTGAGKDFLNCINPNSKSVITGYLEPSLKNIAKEQRFQFERHGYFVADRADHQPEQPVFNLAVGLKDQWKK